MTEQEWREEFAFKLRKAYRSRGYNQKQFAEEVGISEKTLSHYRRCIRTPDAITITNMAAVLDCDVSEIIPVGTTIK